MGIRRNILVDIAIAMGFALVVGGVALAQADSRPEELSVQPGETRVRHRTHPEVRYYKPGNGDCHVVLVEADYEKCVGTTAAWQRLLDYEKRGVPAGRWVRLAQEWQRECPPKELAPDCVAPLRWAITSKPSGKPPLKAPAYPRPGCKAVTHPPKEAKTGIWCPDRGWLTPEDLEPQPAW